MADITSAEREILDEQNSVLVDMVDTLKRLKEMSSQIDVEILDHNARIDGELEQVDHGNDSLDSIRKKMKGIINNPRENWKKWLIFCLFICAVIMTLIITLQ